MITLRKACERSKMVERGRKGVGFASTRSPKIRSIAISFLRKH
jgi:hypothetical protein